MLTDEYREDEIQALISLAELTYPLENPNNNSYTYYPKNMTQARDNLPHPPMAQLEPLGAHNPLEEAVEKVENTLLGFAASHFGHFTSVLLSDILRRTSNFSPQLMHSYSYVGIRLSH